jgi:hypothetical protein
MLIYTAPDNPGRYKRRRDAPMNSNVSSQFATMDGTKQGDQKVAIVTGAAVRI